MEQDSTKSKGKQRAKSVQKNVKKSESLTKEEKKSQDRSVPSSVAIKEWQSREKLLKTAVVVLLIALIVMTLLQREIHTTENLLHGLCREYGNSNDAFSVIPGDGFVTVVCEQDPQIQIQFGDLGE